MGLPPGCVYFLIPTARQTPLTGTELTQCRATGDKRRSNSHTLFLGDLHVSHPRRRIPADGRLRHAAAASRRPGSGRRRHFRRRRGRDHRRRARRTRRGGCRRNHRRHHRRRNCRARPAPRERLLLVQQWLLHPAPRRRLDRRGAAVLRRSRVWSAARGLRPAPGLWPGTGGTGGRRGGRCRHDRAGAAAPGERGRGRGLRAKYRSYDPRSGTFLSNDGMRKPCP